MAALGLSCCGCFFLLVEASRGLLSSCGAWASYCGGFSCCRAWASVVVVYRLSCSTARGVFLDQGLNPCPLHWQADSHPLCHRCATREAPMINFKCITWGQMGTSQVALVVKEPACQCRRHKRCEFDPWVRKMPWRRKGQPPSGFLPRASHGQRSLVSYSL